MRFLALAENKDIIVIPTPHVFEEILLRFLTNKLNSWGASQSLARVRLQGFIDSGKWVLLRLFYLLSLG